jgi:hypothetical protein
MTFRNGLVLPALLAVAACAGPKSATTQAEKFAALTFAADAAATAVAVPATPGDENGYLIEIVLERSDGSHLSVPQIAVEAGRTGGIAVVRPSPLQADAEGVSAAPPPLEDGIRLQACASRAGDGGIVLAFRARMTNVTAAGDSAEDGGNAVPQQFAVEFSGARWLEPGVRGMIARVPSPDGSGQMLVLARATPQRVPRAEDEGVFTTSAPPSDTTPAMDLSRPMTGHTVHLRVSAVRVPRDFTPGAVFDETSTPDVLKVSGGEILRDFEAYSCLDSRVHLSGISGGATFDAALDDSGRVTITWNGRTATVRANEGRRFVAVAPVEGGGTAGVIVSVNADD